MHKTEQQVAKELLSPILEPELKLSETLEASLDSLLALGLRKLRGKVSKKPIILIQISQAKSL